MVWCEIEEGDQNIEDVECWFKRELQNIQNDWLKNS
jgi:hypothetical protein